jgi:hypothetical protein
MDGVRIRVKRFLLLEECPAPWKDMDLYLFRDGDTVFYVGQSYRAFDRVWEHIRNGYKARSDVGRFLLVNWPKSLKFEIELLSSRSVEFEEVGRDPAAAEELLIRRYRPGFNDSLNEDPTALPAAYRPPSSPIRCPRSPRGLRSQAARAVRKDEQGGWIEP